VRAQRACGVATTRRLQHELPRRHVVRAAQCHRTHRQQPARLSPQHPPPPQSTVLCEPISPRPLEQWFLGSDCKGRFCRLPGQRTSLYMDNRSMWSLSQPVRPARDGREAHGAANGGRGVSPGSATDSSTVPIWTPHLRSTRPYRTCTLPPHPAASETRLPTRGGGRLLQVLVLASVMARWGE
jgi:hypothetical protein